MKYFILCRAKDFWPAYQVSLCDWPIAPTQNFLQNGHYRYIRNPMILGFSFYLLGWAFLFNKAGAILTAAVIIVFLLAEVKIIEEKELEKRFGQIYSEYKKETPFLLLRWRSKKS